MRKREVNAMAAVAGNRLQRIVGRFTGGKVRVSEMIGRYVVATAQATLYKFRSYAKTVDATVPDYEFYDKLRRGKATGYTLGGLFCRAIENKFSTWVLGGGLTVALRDDEAYSEDALEHTNTRLAEFVGGLLDAGMDDDTERPDYDDESGALAMTVYQDALGLGDQYIIVNTDGTLSVPSPDTVTVERDKFDYRQVLAVEIQTRTADSLTVLDRYEPTRRTVTVKKGAQIQSEETFQNLIGRIPVVHLAHGRSGNETNGHSIHEDLLPLLSEYDDVAYKQLDGAKLLGNPIPVFENLEDINATIEANDPAEAETYTDRDGNTATRAQVNLDQNSIFFLGKGGRATMLAPPVGFTEDTSNALRTLFLLLLRSTGIPEFVWGGELTSSRSTAEIQLQQWAKDIEARQGDAGGWLVKLCGIWLQMQALTDPQVVVGILKVEWPDLIPEDEETTLRRLDFALDNSLIRRVTALELLHIVDDAQAEADLAQGEADERREEMFPDEAGFQLGIGEDGGREDGEE